MIISLLFLFILSMIYALTASMYYLSWINGKTRSYRGFIVLVITITAFSLFYALSSLTISLISLDKVMTYVFLSLMVIVSLRISLTRPRKTLLSSSPSEIMGIRYYIYNNDELFYAWTDSKKIFITTGLMRILDPRELYIVLLHEKGHIKSRIISYVNKVLRICWMYVVISIPMICLYGLFLEVFGSGRLENSSATVLSLYFIGTIITSTILPLSWICEHTADQYILACGK